MISDQVKARREDALKRNNSGESITSIARLYGVSVSVIREGLRIDRRNERRAQELEEFTSNFEQKVGKKAIAIIADIKRQFTHKPWNGRNQFLPKMDYDREIAVTVFAGLIHCGELSAVAIPLTEPDNSDVIDALISIDPERWGHFR